jgi:hypothetical protein
MLEVVFGRTRGSAEEDGKVSEGGGGKERW